MRPVRSLQSVVKIANTNIVNLRLRATLEMSASIQYQLSFLQVEGALGKVAPCYCECQIESRLTIGKCQIKYEPLLISIFFFRKKKSFEKTNVAFAKRSTRLSRFQLEDPYFKNHCPPI